MLPKWIGYGRDPAAIVVGRGRDPPHAVGDLDDLRVTVIGRRGSSRRQRIDHDRGTVECVEHGGRHSIQGVLDGHPIPVRVEAINRLQAQGIGHRGEPIQ